MVEVHWNALCIQSLVAHSAHHVVGSLVYTFEGDISTGLTSTLISKINLSKHNCHAYITLLN